MSVAPGRPGAGPRGTRTKLSYKDERELAQLPARIESLEAEQAALVARVSQPAFYGADPAERAAVQARLTALPGEIEVAYERWAALETQRDGA